LAFSICSGQIFLAKLQLHDTLIALSMRVLSASEAIAPAINRTKTVLFQPFKIGRSWKLAATAYLSAMGAFFIPTPFFFFGSGVHRTLPLLFSFGFGIIFSGISFVFFYVGARLEFILFDIVLLNEKFVAPSWKRHSHHSWRWIGFKVLFSIVMGVISAPAYYFGYMYLMPRLAAVSAPGQPPSPELFKTLLFFYAVIGLPIGFAFLCSSLLTNFVPSSFRRRRRASHHAHRRHSSRCSLCSIPLLLRHAGHGVCARLLSGLCSLFFGRPLSLARRPFGACS
jgi:hypothetical protein